MELKYSYSFNIEGYTAWSRPLPLWLGDYVLRVTFEDL